jgi:hypothetical protein
MNVKEITEDGQGTLPIYFETALPLTALTIWIVMAFQSKHLFRDGRTNTFWMRLAWPVILFRSVFGDKSKDLTNQTEDKWGVNGPAMRMGDYRNGSGRGNGDARVDMGDGLRMPR